MPEIRIRTKDTGCRKPKCEHKLSITHRHHRRFQSLFIQAFTAIGKKGKKLKTLTRRYEAFRSEDVVRLCAWHHCEIHQNYKSAIYKFLKKTKKKYVFDLNWKEAFDLMKELEEYCLEWEKEETPGVNPAVCGFDWDD